MAAGSVSPSVTRSVRPSSSRNPAPSCPSRTCWAAALSICVPSSPNAWSSRSSRRPCTTALRKRDLTRARPSAPPFLPHCAEVRGSSDVAAATCSRPHPLRAFRRSTMPATEGEIRISPRQKGRRRGVSAGDAVPQCSPRQGRRALLRRNAYENERRHGDSGRQHLDGELTTRAATLREISCRESMRSMLRAWRPGSLLRRRHVNGTQPTSSRASLQSSASSHAHEGSIF